MICRAAWSVLERVRSRLAARVAMARRAIIRPADLPPYLPGHGLPDLDTSNINVQDPDFDDPADVERWIHDMDAELERCKAVFEDVLAGRRSWPV